MRLLGWARSNTWKGWFGTSHAHEFSYNTHVKRCLLAGNQHKRKAKHWVPSPKENFKAIPLWASQKLGRYLEGTCPACQIWIRTDKRNSTALFPYQKGLHPQNNYWVYLFFLTTNIQLKKRYILSNNRELIHAASFDQICYICCKKTLTSRTESWRNCCPSHVLTWFHLRMRCSDLF